MATTTTETQRVEAIPDELRELKRWVCWRSVKRNQKITKVPFLPDGRPAKSNDPSTWSDFQSCWRAPGDYDGVGFVLGDGYVGVDLDSCRDPATGSIEKWAQDIIDRLRSYTEVSPSGTGVHIICRGGLPPGGRRKGPVEMYDRDRYFTITGQRLYGFNLRDCSEELARLHGDLFGNAQSAQLTTSASRAYLVHTPPWKAEALCSLARHCFDPETFAKFSRLWRGEWEDNYPSQSEADAALARYLRMLLPDAGAEEIELYIGLSELGKRLKWTERPDYRQRTVTLVLTPRLELPQKFFEAHLTDLGNAERLVALYGQDLAWVGGWGWLVWNGTRWECDCQRKVEELAAQMVRNMYHAASQLDDPDRRKHLAEWAHKSESRTRIDAAVALARHMVARRAEEFDRDPWLLNSLNGTIDLRTGELRPHRREDYCTKLAPVIYDPAARSKRWERFLDEACGGDPSLMEFLQQAVGYSLTGSTAEEKLFLIEGPAATGKSTFLEAVKATLGDYAWTADFETFIERRASGAVRNDVAELAGRRFVIAIEVDENRRLAVSLIKHLTGGDSVRARFLYRDAFEFVPQFKLWLATNNAPRVSGDDSALWRRILRIPFEHVVPPECRDPELKARLRDTSESGPAILAWAVEGCLKWQRQRLEVPGIVVKASEQYREQSDQLGRFLRECCVVAANARLRASTLYEAYRSWCQGCGEQPLSLTAFGLRLDQRGFCKNRTGTGVFYCGLQLRAQGEGLDSSV